MAAVFAALAVAACEAPRGVEPEAATHSSETAGSGPLRSVTTTELARVPSGTIRDVPYFAYGTFQSHARKVVSNPQGIFLAYDRSSRIENGGSTKYSQWTIERSTDGGSTFRPLFTYTDHTEAPCLEADADGNVYAAYASNDFTDLSITKLGAADGYATATSVQVPGAGTGKLSCAMKDGILYVLGWARLTRVDTRTMSVVDDRAFFVPSDTDDPQYPHLTFDPDETALYFAMNDVARATPAGIQGIYTDVRYAMSQDLGVSWQIPATGRTLALPGLDGSQAILSADVERARAAAPTATAERGHWWGNWLDSFTAADGYLFFMYLAGDLRYIDGTLGVAETSTRFVRTSLTSETPSVTLDRLAGDTYELDSIGASFVLEKAPTGGHVLYAVGATKDNRLLALVSRDDGTTWHDFAVGPAEQRQFYAIGTARMVTSDRAIIGSYTSLPLPGELAGSVGFFRIPLDDEAPPPPPGPAPKAECGGIYAVTANGYTGALVLFDEDGGRVTGTMSFPDALDSTVSGTCTGGRIAFTRQTGTADAQQYEGTYLRTEDDMEMRGTFTDSNVAGVYAWAAATAR
jgi:hypothetical protein